jgi:cell division inhibitor SepF
MSFISNIMKSMKLNQDDDYDLDDDYDFDDDGSYDDGGDAADAEPRSGGFLSRLTGGIGGHPEDDADDVVDAKPRIFGRSRTADDTQRRSTGMEVTMIKPTSMDDSREICDYLLNGKAVVLNMEGLHMEIAQRIIDFTSGAAYSMDGNLQKISNYIFIATPENVELSGDFQNMLAGNTDINNINMRI